MPDIEIGKLDAARRQLDVAVRIFFSHGDEIALHTLAAAARNVLFDLCSHRKVKPPMSIDSLVEDFTKPEHRDLIRRKLRQPENFFKHADRDPEERLIFNSEAIEFRLLEAVEAYLALTRESVPIFQTYRAWWMLKNQDILTHLPADLRAKMGRIQYTDRDRQRFLTDMLPIMSKAHG